MEIWPLLAPSCLIPSLVLQPGLSIRHKLLPQHLPLNLSLAQRKA
jgi:hypothetical protein